MLSHDLHEVIHFWQGHNAESIKGFMVSRCLVTGDVNLDHLELISGVGGDTLKLCKFCFTSNFHLLILTSTGGSYPQ